MEHLELKALKQEIGQLKQEFETKFIQIQNKINQLEQGQEKRQTEKNFDLELDIDLKLDEETIQEPINPKNKTNSDLGKHPTSRHIKKIEDARLDRMALKSNPLIQFLAEIPKDSLLNLATELSGKCMDVYQHFQRQGKASIFFLTLGGIIAFVGGFGYFLQYAFYNLFSNEMKCGSGFLLGAFFILLGYQLMQKKTSAKHQSWREYAAALVGLGLVMNTLALYYLGPYFQWLPITTTLFALAINAWLGYLIAIRFETKIVATISLVGSLATPIYFGVENLNLFSAVTYVFFISIGNTWVAKKIRWQVLPYLCLTLSIVFLETHILLNQAGIQSLSWDSISVIAMILLLFRNYLALILDSLSKQTTMNHSKVMLTTGNLIFSLGYSWQLMNSKMLCLFTFLLMTACVVHLHQNFKRQKIQKSLTLMIASIIIAVAFLRIFENEALALIRS